MRNISIFIAGAKGLYHERTKLKALTNDLNAKYAGMGKPASLSMTSYENFGDRQDEYDDFISNRANMIVFVLDGKIGNTTESEYRLAGEMYHANGRPKILTFVRQFDHRTADIDYMENVLNECKEKYGLDYYIEYSNIEDLEAKAKERIDRYVETECKKDASICRKIWNKPIKWLLLLSTLLLLGCLAFYAIDNKKHVVFSSIELPANIVLDGIDDKFVAEQILKDMKKCGERSQKKLDGIIRELAHHPNDSNVTLLPLNAEMEEITTTSMPSFLMSMRRMIGRDDLTVHLKILESDSSFVGKVDMYDKRHYTKSISERKSMYANRNECVIALINKCAAYMTQAYEPMVSVLYDYDIVDGLGEYEMVSPWHDRLYSSAEREAILTEAAKGNESNAVYCLMLLGDYYEKSWMEQSSPELARKACAYYDEFKKRSTDYQQEIQSRLALMEEYILEDSIRGESHVCLPDILTRNGIITDGLCSQLIIVTNEEEETHQAKLFYKATLYSYEMTEGQWTETYPPFKVNLGARGLAEPNKKAEGDLTTPSGLYGLPFVFGSHRDIETKMDFIEIDKNHVWICDTASADYNKLIKDDNGQYRTNPRNEKLWRADKLYKYAIAIGYNTDPIVKGKGSAIFIHIERAENHRTAGCISIPEERIVELIQWLNPDKKPYIYICKRIPDSPV